MALSTLVEVAAGGAIGAPARFALDRLVGRRRAGSFPSGTFVINLTGAFALGLLTGLTLYHGLGATGGALLATGFCGAYTTFSTFSYETVRLVEAGEWSTAGRYAAGSLVVGLAAAAAGLAAAAL